MVEDYTNAFLVSAFWLCFVTLFAIWAVWGMLAALGISWAANRVIGLRIPVEDTRPSTPPPDH